MRIRVERMASSRTQIANKEINFNNKQIVSKTPDAAICYILLGTVHYD